METHSTLFHQQAEELLRAVACGGDQWQSRRQIAQHLGKRYLSPVEVFVLDVLAEQGQVKIRKSPRNGNGPVHYTVRYKTADHMHPIALPQRPIPIRHSKESINDSQH